MRRRRYVAGAALALCLAACSSNDSSTAPVTPPPPPPQVVTSISGVVDDAFVDNATLTAYEVSSNGTIGVCVPAATGSGCATATTDSNGAYGAPLLTGRYAMVVYGSIMGFVSYLVTVVLAQPAPDVVYNAI